MRTLSYIVISLCLISFGTASDASTIKYTHRASFGDPSFTMPAYSGPGTLTKVKIQFRLKVNVVKGLFDCATIDECFGIASLDATISGSIRDSYSISAARLNCIHSDTECRFRNPQKAVIWRTSRTTHPVANEPLTFFLNWEQQGAVPVTGRVAVKLVYHDNLSSIPLPAAFPLLGTSIFLIGLPRLRRKYLAARLA